MVRCSPVHPHLAHDLRNRLTPILCGLDMAIERGDLSRLAAARAHALDMRDMLLPAAPAQPVDVNALALQAAERTTPGIQVTLRLEKSRPCVLADRIALQRAIFNLLDNAAEALARVGH